MKLLNIQQIREWDKHTIAHEPISSVDLMERAADACVRYLVSKTGTDQELAIFCGTGNNGGDGLAIGRKLFHLGYAVKVHVLRHSNNISDDFNINLARLKQLEADIVSDVYSIDEMPSLPGHLLIIDAILGSGISRPVEGWLAGAIDNINCSGNRVMSIDIPSGLPGDMEQWNENYQHIIKADITLTFQVPKTSFLFSESGNFVGQFKVLDIGLDTGYYDKSVSNWYFIQPENVYPLLKKRQKFDHKGMFGHALLIAGSKGKNGAAILAAKAALRSGLGLLTVSVPRNSYPIMQISVPEAMVLIDSSDDFPEFNIDASKYTAIGLGPGIGTEKITQQNLKKFLESVQQPIVIDADGINLLAVILRDNPDFTFPENTVLTPHVKEFERLAGKCENGFQRWERAKIFAQKHQVHILLKGAHSCLFTPDGTAYFNSTGNPAMAKGGSGDVLTGIITALLAQKYPPYQAALLGMYFHGLAGDAAADIKGNLAVIASDIIDQIRIESPCF